MKVLLASIAAAGLLISHGTVKAADNDGHFAIKGAGSAECSRYLQALDANSSEVGQFIGWANGYLTRINQADQQTFDILPWQTSRFLAILLETHCRSHPRENFGAAVYALAKSLNGQRLSDRTVLTTVRLDGQEFALYDAVVARIRVKLAELGYLVGAEEAGFDSTVRDALRKFQSKHNLKSSGLPDQTTLVYLFYPPGG